MRRKGQSLGGKAGYTLSELLVVIVLIGLLSSIAIPVYNNVRASSLQSAAMHNARLINMARSNFALIVPTSASDWAAAPDDTARLQLLISNSLLPGSPGDYLSMSGGYSVQVSGGIRNQTVLTLDGSPVAY